MKFDVRLKVRDLLRYVEINMHDSKLALGTCVGSLRDRGTETIPEQWQCFPRRRGDWRLHVFKDAFSQTQAYMSTTVPMLIPDLIYLIHCTCLPTLWSVLAVCEVAALSRTNTFHKSPSKHHKMRLLHLRMLLHLESERYRNHFSTSYVMN